MAGWGRCRRCSTPIWWGPSPYDASKVFPFDDQGETQSHFQTCSAQEWVTDAMGDRHQVGKCKACGERVWWDTTPRGRRRPMDCDGDEATWDCHIDSCLGAPASASAEPRRDPYLDPHDAVRLYLGQLGLAWPCTSMDVTRAFRKLALIHHPDMGGEADRFIEIKLAHDRLLDLLTGVVA